MFPEKPKNKQKNDHSSRIRPKLIMLSTIMVLLGGIFAVALPNIMRPSITLSNVQTLQIKNHWMGLSQYAPIQADYDLILSEGSLTGEAIFSLANGSVTQTTSIEIPAEKVQAFITMLETARLETGPYEPYQVWTDDYPYISFLLETDQGEIEIFTSSQGESHTPWGAQIGDIEYVIPSDIPMQALQILEPYLKGDILDTMISEFRP